MIISMGWARGRVRRQVRGPGLKTSSDGQESPLTLPHPNPPGMTLILATASSSPATSPALLAPCPRPMACLLARRNSNSHLRPGTIPKREMAQAREPSSRRAMLPNWGCAAVSRAERKARGGVGAHALAMPHTKFAMP
jgi:hypothetical protein